MSRQSTTVYTDGACLGNPGPGGWAWAVPDGEYRSGPDPATTNQRMEVTAVLEALRALTPERPAGIDVVSDSTYVVNCFRDRWWQGWQRRNWRNSQNKPVANRDLWEPLIELYLERGGPASIEFSWVKGHSGDPMNDLVDRLARALGTTAADLLPAASPPDPLPALVEQARRMLDTLVESGDRDAFVRLNPLLALLVEAAVKRG